MWRLWLLKLIVGWLAALGIFLPGTAYICPAGTPRPNLECLAVRLR